MKRQHALGVLVLFLLNGVTALGEELPLESSLVHTGFIYYYDLGVDPTGTAHAFIDDTLLDQLYYRNNDGGAWNPAVYIDHTSDWGSINVSGAVNTAGQSHIAYDGGRANDALFHARNTSGTWVTGQVIANMRWYALDLGPAPDERPRVAYYDNYSGLNYASQASDGSWSFVNVDNSGAVATFAGRYPDLYVDDQDHGHISYYYYVDQEIRYATNASGTWVWEAVASAQGIASKSYITLAPNGAVLVNYLAESRIWLARSNGSSWDYLPVTEAGSFGQSDIKTDPDGRALVTYNDYTTGKLMLAVEEPGGFTHYELLDHTADGDGPILQVQGTTLHVLAWNQSSQELTYLTGPLAPAGLESSTATNALQLAIRPNPMRAQGLISFNSPGDAAAMIRVVDSLGRILWEAHAPAGQTGRMTIPCRAAEWASGTYYCTVGAGSQHATRRLLVLH